MAKSKKSSKSQTKKPSSSKTSTSSRLWLPTALAAAVASGVWYFQPADFQNHLATTLDRFGINETTLNQLGIQIPSFTSTSPHVEPSDEELYDYEGILRDREIFKVVKMKGKGMGMVAIRDIKQGELVIQEKPLVLAPADEIPRSFIAELYQSWNSSQANTLLSLTWSKLKTNDTLNFDPRTQTEEERYFMTEGIIQNNGVALWKGGKPHLGVFPRMARINHACAGAFNMMFSWREAEDELRVYAIKDVKKGEELTITYIESRKPKDERIKHLNDSYGFTCTCPVCSLPPEQSETRDERFDQITVLYTKFSRWMKGNITGTEAIQTMHELWNLSMELDYPSERGRFAEEAAYVATIHGDQESARQWLELGLKWSSIELGEDSERAQRARYTLDHLDEHPQLGSRERLDVGGPSKEWF